MNNEFEIASQLEREKMEMFIPTFSETFKEFKYQYSPHEGFDCYDLLMKINDKKVVAEIKCRYKHYFNGYYLEQKKYDSLKAKYPDTTLMYIVIGIGGVYVYNLNKINFDTIRLSNEMLPKTSAVKSKLINKAVFTLPLKGAFVKHYDIYLV